jgi:solute carrier family 25 S-adenosylmethionine transporter 26
MTSYGLESQQDRQKMRRRQSWRASSLLCFLLALFSSARLARSSSGSSSIIPSSSRQRRYQKVTGEFKKAVRQSISENELHSYLPSVNYLPRGGARNSPESKTELQSTTSKSDRKNAVVQGLKNALASGLASATCKTILAPFDTVKTVQQHYKGRQALTIMDAAKIVTSRPGGGGFWNLYAGLGVAVVGAMPSVGLYFGVYSYNKQTLGPWLRKHFGSDTKYNFSDFTLQTLTVGTSAGIGNTIASFSRVPYEVVKQRLQSGEFSSTVDALREMMFHSPQGALRAFFPLGGVAAQMARDIPYAIVTLLSYEYIREQWIMPNEQRRGGQSSVWRNMVCGGVAGGFGSYVTNPMDVVKTRLQTASVASSLQGGSASVTQTFADIWIMEGPSAFLKGSVPRLLHKVPANAIFFVCYEFFRRALRVDDSTGNSVESTALKAAPNCKKR